MPDARTRILALLAATALLAPGSAAAMARHETGATAPAQGARVKASLEHCYTGGKTGRAATFRGTMPSLTGLRGRMEMRFQLQERRPGEKAWTPVTGVDSFDEWDLSDIGVGGFIVRKNVGGLEPGYTYRAVIGYRWRDAENRIRRTLKRFTKACRQPDTLPDLIVTEPAINPAARTDVVVYRVFVNNIGRSAAAPSHASLTVNGVRQPAQAVPAIQPKGSQLVIFQAPRCQAGSVIRFAADSDGEVTEGDETNNVLRRRCGTSANSG